MAAPTDTFLDRPPLKMGTYPVTLGAGNWHDILTALEWGQEIAKKEGLEITGEAMARVHSLVLEQTKRVGLPLDGRP